MNRRVGQASQLEAEDLEFVKDRLKGVTRQVTNCIEISRRYLSFLCRRPDELDWRHIAGAGLLGGIGFTMSIFIANLAFPGNAAAVDASKVAVLLASALAGLLGLAWLRVAARVPGR